MAEIKLVSSFARFVLGDIKGGDAAHAYRKEVISTAIEQAYKGNYSPIEEASKLTEGKVKKSRAYAAGFAALGPIGDADGIKKVHYIGSLASHDNKAAREEIAAKTGQSVSAFFVAFDAVMAEKAPKKEKKTDDAPAAGAGAGAGAGDETVSTLGTDATHSAAVALDNAVSNMENMLRTGALTGEQTDRIITALLDSMTAGNLQALSEMIVSREIGARMPIAA